MKQINPELFSNGLHNFAQLLRSERKFLELCWSNNTAYPGTSVKLENKKSKGQCFVTSFYIFWILKHRLNVDGLVHRGELISIDGTTLLKNHCWISFLDCSGERWIIDLTADQSAAITESVIFGRESEIKRLLGVLFIVQSTWTKRKLVQLDKRTLDRCQKLIQSRQMVVPSRISRFIRFVKNVRFNQRKRYRRFRPY